MNTTPASIPPKQEWDALLFSLIYAAGLRIGEALSLSGQNFSPWRGGYELRPNNTGRTVLLQDQELVTRLRARLAQLDDDTALIFQAQKNGRSGPLRQQSMYERWQTYTRQAGVTCSLQQLRHFYGQQQAATQRPDQLSRLLGKRQPQTVRRYYLVDLEAPTVDAEQHERGNSEARGPEGQPSDDEQK